MSEVESKPPDGRDKYLQKISIFEIKYSNFIHFHAINYKNEIIPYNPKLKEQAKKLRKEMTLTQVLL